jgi:hypothetical protein
MTHYHVVQFNPATYEFTNFFDSPNQAEAERALDRVQEIFPERTFTIAPVERAH